MSYQYERLPAPRHIRLVSIQPAEQHAEPIECTIESANLDDVKDQYSALSYSWAMEDGNADKSETVTINSLSCEVTKNLFDGIKRVRRVDRPFCIWIDALCINQDDNAERSSQVAMMADVYSGAETVVIWLGEGDDEDKLMLGVFERIKEISLSKDRSKSSGACFVLPLLGEASSDCPGCSREMEGGGFIINPHRDWLWTIWKSAPMARHEATMISNIAIKFFSKRYWRRRWILQELFFAKRQLMSWGPSSLDISELPMKWLQNFSRAIFRISEACGLTTQSYASAQRNLPDYRELRSILSGLSTWCMPRHNNYREPPRWTSCLETFRASVCSDPRDMYYALASMAKPRFRIDYSLTIAVDVYVHFAETMLKHGEWQWVFGNAAVAFKRPASDGKLDGLPSWAPDPHVASDLIPRHRTAMGIQIGLGRTLHCVVRCLGVICVSSDHKNLQRDQRFFEICRVQGLSDEVPCASQQPSLKSLVRSVGAEDGDILCSCLDELEQGDRWLILRPSAGSNRQAYNLVGTCDPHYEVWGSMYARPPELPISEAKAWFPTCPKLKVRIV